MRVLQKVITINTQNTDQLETYMTHDSNSGKYISSGNGNIPLFVHTYTFILTCIYLFVKYIGPPVLLEGSSDELIIGVTRDNVDLHCPIHCIPQCMYYWTRVTLKFYFLQSHMPEAKSSAVDTFSCNKANSTNININLTMEYDQKII